MCVQRVALLFDNSARPDTTGLYCRRALGNMMEVEHFLPQEAAGIPAAQFDLFLQVDDGLRFTLPPQLKPSALWLIDTHIDFQAALAKAQAADFVFAAQRNGTERLRGHGIDATWLPLACDPELHGRQKVATRYDVAFVGNVLPGPREELLTVVQQRFPRTFVGRRYLQAMAETYSAARIVINRSVADDVNMRVFEALCSGSLLITNDLSANGQADLFRDSLHLVTYREAVEALEKIAWYLAHPDERERIAAAGRDAVLAEHTYRHRMELVLDVVQRRLARQSSRGTPPRSVEAKPLTASADANGKDASYFGYDRPELLKRVPVQAARILDVGCGAGRLGERLKQRQTCQVWGIERDRTAAQWAAARLDRVISRDAETVDGEIEPGSFDCIVCGDVLEHLCDPGSFLGKARCWLNENGVLVASLPNVRHHSVVRSLLEGNWTYEPAGLLDDDHVRFFTRREIEKLFFRSGYVIRRLAAVPGEGYAEWTTQGRPSDVRVGGLTYRARDEADAAELFTYQYLVEAVPAEPQEFGLTSIVIVTHNQMAYTRACVESIRHVTDEPYELIFVDNGSTDETPGYLESLSGATVIRNPENRGFPAAANQGLAAANGAQILLLNNDTLVTTGWLRRMLAALHRDPEVGLVGPLSNNVSGEQRIAVNYAGLNDLDGFAWDLAEQNAGQTRETDRLVGFCLLIKREAFQAVGGLDERFGIGNFEDDDFCRRARQAGYRAVVASDAFVHHAGGATFRATGIDFSALMEENRKRFDTKWSTEVPVAVAASPKTITAPQPVAADPPRVVLDNDYEDGLKLKTNTIRLSLCMIVRDNEHTIRAALESIKPFVDELVVVDTGSTDATPDICRELGARLFHFEWCDDFSAARNESLKHARGEWIFWMDSDDEIPSECGRKLRGLVEGEHAADVLGYVMQVHCPGRNAHEVTMVDHVKLFRNRPDLRFEYRIHEQILQAIRRAGGDIRMTDIHVVHSGSDRTSEGRRRKLERDHRLLELDLQERPDDPFVLYNLGMTYDDEGKPEEAIRYLSRCLSVADPDASIVGKAYALLANSQQRTGRRDEAEVTCVRGLQRFSDDPELRFRLAALQHASGRLEEAATNYRNLLQPRKRDYLASFDVGIVGYKARQNLALVYSDMNCPDKAVEQWREILREKPAYRDAWRGIADVYLTKGHLADVERLIHEMQDVPELGSETAIQSARLEERCSRFDEARGRLERAAEAFPDDPEPLHELARLMFERFGAVAAEPVLLRLAELCPEDGAVFHNLGSVYAAGDRLEAAVDALKKSVELRPDFPATWRRLAESLERLGRTKEAESARHRSEDVVVKPGP